MNRSEMETNVRHDPQPSAQLVRPGCNEEVRRSKSCPDTIIFCGEGTGSSLVRGMGGETGASSDSSARELISQFISVAGIVLRFIASCYFYNLETSSVSTDLDRVSPCGLSARNTPTE